jgi:hypothetical protein
LPCNSFISTLLRAYTLILQKSVESHREVLHQGGLLVVGLKKSCLIRSKLFKFGLEELGFKIRNRFLVKYQDLRNIIVVDLSIMLV